MAGPDLKDLHVPGDGFTHMGGTPICPNCLLLRGMEDRAISPCRWICTNHPGIGFVAIVRVDHVWQYAPINNQQLQWRVLNE